MSADLILRAQAGDEAAFADLVEPHRRELQLHCYRILGSTQDAEDALQEALLAAWQGIGQFEGRASIRTWLHRIATNRCLNMLRAVNRRAAPAAPTELELPEPTRVGEASWLEPYPDALIEGIADRAPGPDARYETREAISLAFMTALQLLPPRQRAALILRDVIGYPAREVAHMLDSTEESVTSALKRARAKIVEALPEAAAPLPRSTAESAIVERFVSAFESHDLAGVVEALTDDVLFTMPPLPFVWEGRDRAARFLAAMTYPGRRLVPTRANGQPAFGLYLPNPHDAVRHAMGLLVLTCAGDRISAITRFEPGVLRHFGLPRFLPAEA